MEELQKFYNHYIATYYRYKDFYDSLPEETARREQMLDAIFNYNQENFKNIKNYIEEQDVEFTTNTEFLNELKKRLYYADARLHVGREENIDAHEHFILQYPNFTELSEEEKKIALLNKNIIMHYYNLLKRVFPNKNENGKFTVKQVIWYQLPEIYMEMYHGIINFVQKENFTKQDQIEYDKMVETREKKNEFIEKHRDAIHSYYLKKCIEAGKTQFWPTGSEHDQINTHLWYFGEAPTDTAFTVEECHNIIKEFVDRLIQQEQERLDDEELR